MNYIFKKTNYLVKPLIVLLAILCCGCGIRYQEIKPRILKTAQQVEGAITQNGISVAIEPYNYSGRGLNYIQAGIRPIKVIISNNSGQPIIVNPNQVMAYGTNGNIYLTYKTQEAAQLVINSHAMEALAQGALGGAAAGAAIGALFGLAVGAIFNVDTGRTALSGALGGSLGGAAGGMKGTLNRLRAGAQAEITNNALTQTVVAPGLTISGWVYFPGEFEYREVRIATNQIKSPQPTIFRIPMPQQTYTAPTEFSGPAESIGAQGGTPEEH